MKTRRRQARDYLMRIKAVGAGLVLASNRVVVAEQLPTTLPTSTASIAYSSQQYTGTMPTEFGRLTDLTYLNVEGNAIPRLRQLQEDMQETLPDCTVVIYAQSEEPEPELDCEELIELRH